LGRDVGCNLPTKDTGKSCKNSSQCEGYCAPDPSLQSNTCTCSSWHQQTKGLQIYCTDKGVEALQVD
jgi:hypothetical protein